MDIAWFWREFKKDGARWPNLITELRLVLSFVPGLLYLWNSERYSWQQLAAMLLFVLLASTDKLDGYVARATDSITVFGAFLDQFTDKVFIVAVLVCLSIVHPWIWAITVIITARETYVLYLRKRSVNDGIGDLAVKQGGKVKTVAQCVMIAVLIFFLPVAEGSVQQLFVISVVSAALLLTVASGYDYHTAFYEAKRIQQRM